MAQPRGNYNGIIRRPPLSRIRMTGVIGAPRLLYHRFTFTRIPNTNKIVEYLKLMKRVILPGNPNRDTELKIIMKSVIEMDYDMRDVALRIYFYAWKVIFREMSPDLLQSISEYTLENIRHKERYFTRVTAIIRQSLAKIYGKYHGRFKEAISLLKEIPLDSNLVRFSTHFKIEINLLLGGLFVNTENPELGAEFLEKSKPLLKTLGFTDEKIAFCVNLAREMDLKEDYVIASRVFHQLIHETILDIAEAIEIRQSTIACSVMTPVGLWRTEFLEKLCVDHRYHKYVPMDIIIKMKNMHEVILPKEIKALDPVMKPHHKEQTEYGINRLEYVTCEHNLLVISKTRRRMKIDKFKSVLHVKPTTAKQIATKMIAEERLEASIHKGFIHFKAPARVANQTDDNN